MRDTAADDNATQGDDYTSGDDTVQDDDAQPKQDSTPDEVAAPVDGSGQGTVNQQVNMSSCICRTSGGT